MKVSSPVLKEGVGMCEEEQKVSKVYLTQQEFDALYDYSCSIPTGTTIGKKWKRRNDYHDASKGWMQGEYVPCEEEGRVGIDWREIVVGDPDLIKFEERMAV